MKVLLDTHVLLWWLLGNPRLSSTASAVLGDVDRYAVGRNKRSALRRTISNTLAKVAFRRDIARPILWKQLRPHVAMERRMRPIADARDQAVLDRIDITVLDVAAEILVVADQVFPKPTLPDASFAARKAHRASQLGLRNGFGEVDFDQPPTQRKIGVAGRQRPNRVDMIGQHHHGVDRKGVARPRKPRRLAQHVDIVRQKASPVQQIDGEEPASAGYKGTAIIRHGGNDRLARTQAARRVGF